LGLPLVLLCLLVGVAGLRWGMANLEQWQAWRLLKGLEAGQAGLPGTAERQQLASAHERLDRAERLRGQHPEQFNLRGRLYHWEAINLDEVGGERSERLARAIEHYRQALAMRPNWPYFWANLTLAKAERGVFDREFRHALERAIDTGPWEPRLQLALIRMDFIEGSRIDRRSRERIDGQIRRALQINPSAVLRLATEFGQMDRVCAWAEDARVRNRCARE
jgi:tetratricopeptide (TPR) repeat protein